MNRNQLNSTFNYLQFNGMNAALDKSISQAWSEYKHSLTFRIRRYYLVITPDGSTDL